MIDETVTIAIRISDIGLLSEALNDYLNIKSRMDVTGHDADLIIEARRINCNLGKILDLQLLKLQN
jgi:hypothetical protein